MKCTVVGGIWMQLEKLAKGRSEEEDQTASWFDLLLIDEASQVRVARLPPTFYCCTVT